MKPDTYVFSEEFFLKAHDDLVRSVADQMSQELYEQHLKRIEKKKQKQNIKQTQNNDEQKNFYSVLADLFRYNKLSFSDVNVDAVARIQNTRRRS
jgi:hypothetical protein